MIDKFENCFSDVLLIRTDLYVELYIKIYSVQFVELTESYCETQLIFAYAIWVYAYIT